MEFITNKEELKAAYSALTVDLSLKSISSFIDAVEYKLRAILGTDTADKIKNDPLALESIRKSIANLSLESYSSSGAILISDSGIHVSKSDKLLPASDKKLLSFRRDCKERGWTAFEQLIAVIESKTDVFSEWKDSQERKQYFNTFFYSSVEFSSFSGSSISSDLFHILKPHISFVEEDVLEKNFGSELVKYLREKTYEGNLSIHEKKLLRYFLRITGPLALVEAIPYRLVQISDAGLYQSAITTSSGTDNIENFSPVQQRILNNLMVKLTSSGESSIVTAQKWLNDNIAQFPLYSEKKIYPIQNFNEPQENIYLL
ncbi:DUF6712 family protein [Sphingobacterium spiritivorum]|uniref:DUF6712 family protein n=1 Tax=Sphingobacterium spiritivorum TaxID=258 RepID=UPI003DA60C6E